MDGHTIVDPDREPLDQPEPEIPEGALVVQCWNKWIRVSSPQTGEHAWVNLRESAFAELAAAVERAGK